MKVWKTKQGEKITAKEFVNRWKQGIEDITPLQQIKTQIYFTRILLFGILCGFFIAIYSWKNMWWLAIVLGAAFGNTFVQIVALQQKKKMISQMEQSLQICKEVEDNEIKR